MIELFNPFIIFVAGPNGSGKTTLINSLMNYFDKIKISVPYLCPDIFARLSKEVDEYGKMRNAQEMTNIVKEQYVNNKKSFILESVASHPSHLQFLSEAKRKGYFIIVFFITTDDPNININRVNKRVSQGGHDVPKEKIISRYYNSMNLLYEYIYLSDDSLLIDNSSSKYKAIFAKTNSKCYLFERTTYVDDYLLNKLPNVEINFESSLHDFECNEQIFVFNILNKCI